MLSGKATAGAASGAGEARGSCPPTGPILAPGAPCPQTLGEQMPGSLFPEGVGWGEAADSLLMGTGGGGDVERVLVSSEGRAGAVGGRYGSHTYSREALPRPEPLGPGDSESPGGCWRLPVPRPCCSQDH